MKHIIPAALCLALLPATLNAQSAQFTDPAAIDREVERFTGAARGTPGGARAPVDRRLRLTRCGSYLSLSLYGAREDSVQVSCPDGAGWRIFVPLAKASATAAAAQSQQMVARGDRVSIAIEGRGFSIVQSGEAVEGGAAGDWIRVQPPGKTETVRARIERPGRVVIPLG